MTGFATPVIQLLRSGVSVRSFATVQPFLQPIQHLALDPSHSVLTERYPLGELTGLFQPCDVLRRVQNQLL